MEATPGAAAPASGTVAVTPIPDGSVLVHIGPPKTATTQLQAALFAARPQLLAHGVRHAGTGRHPASAVHAVLGTAASFAGGAVPPMARWRELVASIVRAREPRVVVSSEFFADAPPDAVQRIVGDLGRRRVHVVVTLRPLARVLPSQWMQSVCDGATTSWERWLHGLFDEDGARAPQGFWRRHRHHELVARWAGAVGRDRVTVLALRDGARGEVLGGVEGLLALEPGLLREQEGLGNRSLTWPEVEAARRFNVRVRRDGLSRVELHRVMHFGASRYLKLQPADPAAARIELPDWALPHVRAEAEANVTRIAASGVTVLGELAGLAAVPEPTGRSMPDSAGSATVAANLGVGVLIATGLARPGSAEGGDDLSAVPTRVVAGFAARRVAKACIRRLPLPRRRGDRGA